MMMKAGRAQGLVVQWLATLRLLPEGFVLKNGCKQSLIAIIPTFLAWGDLYCFCKHISSEPQMFAWKGVSSASPSFSPAIASLLSLIWYHLLQHQKTSPFREWFREDEWEEEGSTAFEQLENAEVLVPMIENVGMNGFRNTGKFRRSFSIGKQNRRQ